MTIAQLARAAGVPSTTIRYYERAKILLPSARTASGYRHYDESALERLEFIRAARAAGFTIDDVTALLALRDRAGSRDCRMEVRELLEVRIRETDTRLAELRRVRRALAATLARCHTSAAECVVMRDLNSGKRPRKRSGA